MIGRIASFSLMASAEPAFAELHAKEDRSQLQHLYRATSRWMFALNFPLVLLTILFAKPLLAIFGESFISGSLALILLSLTTLVTVSTGLAGTVIEMAGYTPQADQLDLATRPVCHHLGALHPRWGVVGGFSRPCFYRHYAIAPGTDGDSPAHAALRCLVRPSGGGRL